MLEGISGWSNPQACGTVSSLRGKAHATDGLILVQGAQLTSSWNTIRDQI